MIERQDDTPTFKFGIKIFKKEDGGIGHQVGVYNDGILTEVVIAEMRAYLRMLENNYFDDFEKDLTDFK